MCIYSSSYYLSSVRVCGLDSLIRILLGVDCLQSSVVILLLDKLSASTMVGQRYVIKLLCLCTCSQLQGRARVVYTDTSSAPDVGPSCTGEGGQCGEMLHVCV